jgi:hypothetical protein
MTLSRLGGFPSYVELLNRLEMAKSAGSPTDPDQPAAANLSAQGFLPGGVV